MEKLIHVVNKLQDVFNIIGSDIVQLPQIVVVGAQSSGKSSVIENIVGRDFLPRGTGVVTRRPLILQLVHTKNEENDHSSCCERAYFFHRDGEPFDNFDQVRAEITKETERVAGCNKAIHSEPIGLKIFSPNVIDLTLIDLPGLTKIPVGNQPDDIESRIRNMLVHYISNPNSIILAITPANQDFATSEALKLAFEVDPQGVRTLAVLTKLDLMDRGTDAVDILLGRVIPVKLGIIGVVNRSQHDVDTGKSIKEALRHEAKFLKEHYPTLASCNGTPYLSKMLNRLLMHHIRQCLPQLKMRVNAMTSHFHNMLGSLGDPVIDKAQMLLQIITRFACAYCSTVEGTSKNIETTELCGGARICYIFHETYANALQGIDPTDDLRIMDVLTAMRNATGTRPALFIPEVSFELLVKREIKRLLEPSLRCVELVHEEMQRIVQNCGVGTQQDMTRFPKLYEQILDVVTTLLRSRLPITNQMVDALIAVELAYINTKHPDFDSAPLDVLLSTTKIAEQSPYVVDKPGRTAVGKPIKPLNKVVPHVGAEAWQESSRSVSSLNSYQSQDSSIQEKLTDSAKEMFKDLLAVYGRQTVATSNGPSSTIEQQQDSPQLSSREMRDCRIILQLIRSYFNIVRKNIQDAVPKTTMHFLVNYVRDNLQSELVRKLYQKDLFEELLMESEHVMHRRMETTQMMEKLQKASQVISEVREVHLL